MFFLFSSFSTDCSDTFMAFAVAATELALLLGCKHDRFISTPCRYQVTFLSWPKKVREWIRVSC